jgi:hypothetical protein
LFLTWLGMFPGYNHGKHSKPKQGKNSTENDNPAIMLENYESGV